MGWEFCQEWASASVYLKHEQLCRVDTLKQDPSPHTAELSVRILLVARQENTENTLIVLTHDEDVPVVLYRAARDVLVVRPTREPPPVIRLSWQHHNLSFWYL